MTEPPCLLRRHHASPVVGAGDASNSLTTGARAGRPCMHFDVIATPSQRVTTHEIDVIHHRFFCRRKTLPPNTDYRHRDYKRAYRHDAFFFGRRQNNNTIEDAVDITNAHTDFDTTL